MVLACWSYLDKPSVDINQLNKTVSLHVVSHQLVDSQVPSPEGAGGRTPGQEGLQYGLTSSG